MAAADTPNAAQATVSGEAPISLRDNGAMHGVSQALAEFANHQRPQPGPGIEIVRTPRYQITLQPDFPAPGPNSVSWVTCSPSDLAGLVEEVHSIVRPRRLPLMWVLGPDSRPRDLGVRLAEFGINPSARDPEVAVMVRSAAAVLEDRRVEGLEIRDALADSTTFQLAAQVATEVFEARPSAADPESLARLERRRLSARADRSRRHLLALVDGEPAASGGLTLFPPVAATLNGGSVRPKFRGRGVYRALVAARLEMARKAEVEGLTVWGGEMSGPILSRLGFVKVGWRRFYVDETTVP
jgi:GNAT superfamily N-acetyltransferase